MADRKATLQECNLPFSTRRMETYPLIPPIPPSLLGRVGGAAENVSRGQSDRRIGWNRYAQINPSREIFHGRQPGRRSDFFILRYAWRLDSVPRSPSIFSQFFGPARGGIDGRFLVEFGFTDWKNGPVGVDPPHPTSTSECDTGLRRPDASYLIAKATVLKIAFIGIELSRNREIVQ
jgi:hypothetical protein